jgi:hypothetical protein
VKGWRWIFWLLRILGGVITISAFVIMTETCAPTILQRKAERLRKTTGNVHHRSKLDFSLKPRQLLARSIIWPLKMLFLSPIVMALSIFMALGYGYLYLLFTTFTKVFEEQYGFNSGRTYIPWAGDRKHDRNGRSWPSQRYDSEEETGEWRNETRVPASANDIYLTFDIYWTVLLWMELISNDLLVGIYHWDYCLWDWLVCYHGKLFGFLKCCHPGPH